MSYSITTTKALFDSGKVEFLFFDEHSNIPNAWFSQWYTSPFSKRRNTYLSSGHWMMVQKARLFGDTEGVNKLLKSLTPSEMKYLGRQINGFDEQKWDHHKIDIVFEGNLLKFSQNNLLLTYLLETEGKILVEANPNDDIWGIGMSKEHELVGNPNFWKGQNLLGFTLMDVRANLQMLKGIQL